MKYQIVCIGRMKDAYFRDIIAECQEQIKRSGSQLEIAEYPDLRIPDRLQGQEKERFLEKECARIMERIQVEDYMIALCIEGKELTTGQHRQYVRDAVQNGKQRITYVIGGSLGLPEKLKKRADLKFSFSRMTFPHQMMRMVLCEEIVRVHIG